MPTLCSCIVCKKQYSTNNIQKHYNSKSCNIESTKYIKTKEYYDRKLRSNCIHCGAFKNTFTSLTQHEIRCVKSSNNVQQLTCTMCNSSFLSKRFRYRCNNCKRRHSDKTKETLKLSMKQAVIDNPNSYAGNYNRGHVKTYTCSNGFIVLGTWEQKFVEYCIRSNIKIQQPNIGFSYEWNGIRTYYPDFYLPETDTWVEVKGIKTDRDKAKWKSLTEIHKKKLLVIESIKNFNL